MNRPLETLVFVYGTLQPGGRFHDAYCGEFAFEAVEASTQGRIYDFPRLGYPGAVEDGAQVMHGFLLRFKHPPTEVLPRLDALEGYEPNRNEDLNEYYRKEVEVATDSPVGKRVRAWCYFTTENRVDHFGGVRVRSGKWQP